MGMIVGGGMDTMGLEEMIEVEVEEEGAESIPMGMRLLLFFGGD